MSCALLLVLPVQLLPTHTYLSIPATRHSLITRNSGSPTLAIQEERRITCRHSAMFRNCPKIQHESCFRFGWGPCTIPMEMDWATNPINPLN